jgi:mannose-6-phosphate isomerase-like protein (cupin superfamily)
VKKREQYQPKGVTRMTNYVHPTQKSMSQKRPTDEVALFEDLVMVDLHTLSPGVTEEYKNFVISSINDHCLRMAVMKGEYRWHQHESSAECFLTLEGCLEIDLCDGRTIKLLPGQSFKIPGGTVHRTRAASRTVNLCFERLTAYTDVKFGSSGE